MNSLVFKTQKLYNLITNLNVINYNINKYRLPIYILFTFQ